MNGVYNLPSQNILLRWTKYAKSGFYIETKQGSEEGDWKTQATFISRQATSLALKCRHQKNYFQIDFQYISRWQIIYSIYIADSKSMFALYLKTYSSKFKQTIFQKTKCNLNNLKDNT
jgi:hypothetical protein